MLHMRDAILLIGQFLMEMDEDQFRNSLLHRSATERQLEIIGEASNAISDELKNKFPEVEWQPIKRFRNVIVHEYFGVSTQILWGLIQKELPVLKSQIEKILSSFQADDSDGLL